MNTLRIGVVIARFQPLLTGQIEHLLIPAVKNSDLVVILLGSSGKARTCVDPFDTGTRLSMIEQSLVDYETPLAFYNIRDFMYAETPVDWIVQVQSKVGHAIKHQISDSFSRGKKTEVTIYGAEDSTEVKDYHNWFPQWSISVKKLYNVRTGSEDSLKFLFEDGTVCPGHTDRVKKVILDWLDSSEGQRIKSEYSYVKEYKKRTQTGNYPIQFNTTDNVCYYKGNILLVKRRSQPGKGLWALPGGFLEVDETCKQGAVRELLEETKLRVRDEWLVSRGVFDHPRRSVRGRTITNAFLWKIPDSSTFPKVTAGSDASRVKWFPLSTILEEMQEQLFEDHLDIIGTLTKRL